MNIKGRFWGTILTFSIVFFIMGNVYAADDLSSSVAYVNVAKILTESKEAKEARATLEKEILDWRKSADKMYSEIQQMEQDLSSTNMMLSDDARTLKQDELNKKKSELQTYLQEYQSPDGKISKRETELLKPVEQKILSILDEVAREKGLSMIFDSSAGVLVWASDDMDITDLVIERLNKEEGTGVSGADGNN